MSNYTITTDFGAKDSLPSSNDSKVVRGSEFTTEFTNIQTAIATKADTAGDTFTGVVNFSADVAVNTNTLFVDVSEAKVGIGTTNPANTLTVGNLTASADDQDGTVGIKCNTNHKGIVLQENSGAEQWEIGVGEAGALKFYDSGSATPAVTFEDETGNVGIGGGTISSKLFINTDTVGDSYFRGGADNSRQLDFSTFATASPNAGHKIDATSVNGVIALATGSTERMRIDTSGHVGIGSTNPDSALEVEGSVNGVHQIHIQNTFDDDDADAPNPSARLYLSAASNNAYIQCKGAPTDLGTQHEIDFGSTAAGSFITFSPSSTERMRIDSAGNVGIGTTDPSAKLEVSATAPTYTNLGTVLWGGTTNNDNHTGISLSSSGDALGGSVGSNLYYSNSNTATQSNTNRSSGEIKIDNTTSTGTSTIRLGGYAKGTTTFDEHMRIDESGNLLVGTTSNVGAGSQGVQITGTGEILTAKSSTALRTHLSFVNSNGIVGSISTSSSATSYNTSSDERLKENIADSADAGSKVDAIKIRQFNWKADGSHQDYGVIAQELATVAPEAVHQPEDSEEMMGVDYSKLVPMLIKEVQSLRSRVAELENA